MSGSGDIRADDERATQLRLLQAEMRACRLCVEAEHIVHAQPVFGGRATDRLMVIGQAPGPVSEDKGYPFAGPAGRTLKDWLVQAGFPEDYFRERTYLTSLTRCFPGRSPHGEGDRPPSRAERLLCRPYLDAELRLVSPRIILLVGRLAVEEFLGRARLDEAVGTAVEGNGALLLPLPHPSGVSRWLNSPANRRLLAQALTLLSEARERLGL